MNFKMYAAYVPLWPYSCFMIFFVRVEPKSNFIAFGMSIFINVRTAQRSTYEHVKNKISSANAGTVGWHGSNYIRARS